MADTSWSKSLMSYWWFGVSNCGCPLTKCWVSVPMLRSPRSVSWPLELAGTVRWCGLAVEA